MALVLTSDFQCGSRWGLWPPDFKFEDGSSWDLSDGQRWLWRCYTDFVKSVPKKSKLVFNGDAIQGVYKPTTLVTASWEYQVEACLRIFEPLVDKCTEVHLVYGTEFHEMEGSQAVRAIYAGLKHMGVKVYEPQLELWLQWEGHLIHVAHHRPTTGSPMSKATPLAGELAKMLVTAPQRCGRYPDIIVRSHAHDPGYLRCTMGISIALPGWQRKDHYVYAADPACLTRVGGIYLTTEDDTVVPHEKFYDVPTPSPRRL